MTNYQPLTETISPTLTVTKNQTAQSLVRTIVQAADDRKAADIVGLKVTEVSYLTDYFIIVTGFSRTQVRAIADAIEDKVVLIHEQLPLRTEGKSEGSWVLQDFGEVIVHIFLPEEREFYNLEAFWGHAERFELSQLSAISS